MPRNRAAVPSVRAGDARLVSKPLELTAQLVSNQGSHTGENTGDPWQKTLQISSTRARSETPHKTSRFDVDIQSQQSAEIGCYQPSKLRVAGSIPAGPTISLIETRWVAMARVAIAIGLR